MVAIQNSSQQLLAEGAAISGFGKAQRIYQLHRVSLLGMRYVAVTGSIRRQLRSSENKKIAVLLHASMPHLAIDNWDRDIRLPYKVLYVRTTHALGLHRPRFAHRYSTYQMSSTYKSIYRRLAGLMCVKSFSLSGSHTSNSPAGIWILLLTSPIVWIDLRNSKPLVTDLEYLQSPHAPPATGACRLEGPSRLSLRPAPIIIAHSTLGTTTMI